LNRKLKEQVELAVRTFRKTAYKLFELAFISRKGRRRGVLREARAAYNRWKKGRSLSKCAVDTVLGFIASAFALGTIPSAT
jgi:hypothetical protein